MPPRRWIPQWDGWRAAHTDDDQHEADQRYERKKTAVRVGAYSLPEALAQRRSGWDEVRADEYCDTQYQDGHGQRSIQRGDWLAIRRALSNCLSHVFSKPLMGWVCVESRMPPLRMDDRGELRRRFERDETIEIDGGREQPAGYGRDQVCASHHVG